MQYSQRSMIVVAVGLLYRYVLSYNTSGNTHMTASRCYTAVYVVSDSSSVLSSEYT